MNESADIKAAIDRLQNALQKLEGAIDPLLTKLSRLEKVAVESKDFDVDRAQLAQKLDAAVAKEKKFEAREAEFAELAADTTQELDRVIKQVRYALSQASGGA